MHTPSLQLAVVLEYMDGGTLAGLVAKVSVCECVCVCVCVCVCYMLALALQSVATATVLQ
jgi:hypothetical protein